MDQAGFLKVLKYKRKGKIKTKLKAGEYNKLFSLSLSSLEVHGDQLRDHW